MFNLQKEIKNWKKSLKKHQGLEDGYIEELESHLLEMYDAFISNGMKSEKAFNEAVLKMGEADDIGNAYYRTDSKKISKSIPQNKFSWMPALLANYLIAAIRSVKRQKLYSSINIIGLAIGLTACMLISQYVVYEKSYDKFHEDAENIYRIRNDRFYPTRHDKSAGCPAKLGPALLEDFPEVMGFTRLKQYSAVFKYQEKVIRENRTLWAEPSFFEIFNFPVISGSSISLADKNTAVITKSIAEKYFGKDDPLGKVITLDFQEFKIIAVAENSPENTYIKWDILTSFVTQIKEDYCWDCNNNNTFIKVKDGTIQEEFEEKLPSIVKKLHSDSEIERAYFLQPLIDIHLHSNLRWELEKNSDAETVNTLTIIAFAILLIAWLNFINLATARSIKRAKEVGMRKVIGARRIQLIRQFLIESFLMNLLAGIAAILFMLLLLPIFRSFANIPMDFSIVEEPIFWFAFLIVIFSGSILSGLYPAFVLSSYKPTIILKGLNGETNKGTTLRKTLIVFQFAISIFLIAGTIVVFEQVNFMKNNNLGIDINNTLVLEFPTFFEKGTNYYSVRDAFINEIKQFDGINDVTFSSLVPGQESGEVRGGVRLRGDDESKWQQIYSVWTAKNFMDVMKINVITGAEFTDADRFNFKDYASDDKIKGIMINESARKALGFSTTEEALGKIVVCDENRPMGRIKAVVEDYHELALDKKINPTIIHSAGWGAYFLIKLESNQLQEKISLINTNYNKIFPGNVFNYFFLDEYFDKQYKKDIQFNNVFGVFSLLTIIVGCLGLYGLTTFSVTQKTKEIGIRKALGASSNNIVVLFTKDFIKLIFISTLISIPLAILVMKQWLSDYANKIGLDWWFFLVPVLFIVLIAMLTISGQVIKAALSRPAEALKYE